MDFGLVRTLRTSSSERYVLQAGKGNDIAALDLHFLSNGAVAGTLFLFEEHHPPTSDLPQLLSKLDEQLLPMADLGKNLSFTVVVGKVLGTFTPDKIKTD